MKWHDSRFRETASAGHSIFIVSELHDSVTTYADVYEMHHVKSKDIANFFRRLTILDTLEAGNLVLYKLGDIFPNEITN